MILGFHHAAISSPDIERLIGFYTEKLGATVLRRGGWDNPIEAVDKRLGLEASTCRIAILRVGLTYLELFEFDGAEARGPKRTASVLGIAHRCFQGDDCWEEYRRLSALGVEFHDEPPTMPTGATFTY
ncbi:MAG: VOC family protein, partial [Parvularculaceae bacterium]|nr:VOC family protein [Parvularculaceae bacterium]